VSSLEGDGALTISNGTNGEMEGQSLWNTPAGSAPSPFAQLDMTALSRLTPDELAEIWRSAQEQLKKDPIYQSFKRGAEESRRMLDPTLHWNKHAR
jgi:hypothetical protein